jgi:hypothetical protein
VVSDPPAAFTPVRMVVATDVGEGYQLALTGAFAPDPLVAPWHAVDPSRHDRRRPIGLDVHHVVRTAARRRGPRDRHPWCAARCGLALEVRR